MYIYEAVAATLARQGIHAIFGYLGDDIAKIVAACQSQGIAFYNARHENQAVAMADGYARASGQLAIAAVTGGPGFTNALTALNTASKHGSPIVVLVGAGMGGPKDLSHPNVCAAMSISCIEPASAELVIGGVRDAIAAALNRRPTLLSLPTDFLDVPHEDSEIAAPPVSVVKEVIEPHDDAIERVAELITADWLGRRPVIIAGHGAILADAGPAIRALAKRIGALLFTTLRAPGLFAGDAFYAGVVGTYATPLAVDLLRNADVVIAFGASLNKFSTFGHSLFPQATLVHVDEKQGAIGAYVAVDEALAIHGDARVVAEALHTSLIARNYAAEGFRTSATAQRIASHDPFAEFEDIGTPGSIDPRTLALHVDAILPEARVVVIDGGNNSAFWVRYLTVQAPRDFMQTSYVGGAGGIGLSLGAAIGAAMARPEALVVNAVGDAAHLMALADLETAVRYRVPLVVLIANDSALGAEVQYLSLVGLPTAAAVVPSPDFTAIAQAMGAEAFAVESIADLDILKQRLRTPIEGPIVLDCRIAGSVRADWVDFLWANRILPLPG